VTKQIPLTQGQVALVDDWWFDYLSQWKWLAIWNGDMKGYYAFRSSRENGKQKLIGMHRVVAKTPERMFTDHINHNTLDNREQNLRNATPSQNGMNRRVQSNNKVGEKCIHKSRNGYRVFVYKNGKHFFNKRFPTLEDAIAARDKVLKEAHGEYACH
jgi:hypothetical protein